jgi:hypothetical protein
MDFSSWIRRRFGASGGEPPESGLYYFEDILPRELALINKRPGRRDRPIGPNLPEKPRGGERPIDRPPSPDPNKLFSQAASLGGGGGPLGGAGGGGVDPRKPERFKMQPQPVPCDATGLAFSGGGIRSAAICLGALQALHSNERMDSIDYLSTVSGGGYIGACLSAVTSDKSGRFPFGEDVYDSPAVGHLRNYSNYLMPRNRSGLRNAADAAAVILRGLAANAVATIAVILLIAALTVALLRAGMPRLLEYSSLPLTSASFGLLLLILLMWSWLRGFVRFDGKTGDTAGLMLGLARWFVVITMALLLIELQPSAIAGFISIQEVMRGPHHWLADLIKVGSGGMLAFAGAVSAFASALGRFLEKSRRKAGPGTLLLRGLAKVAVLIASLVLPGALWVLYLWLCARALEANGGAMAYAVAGAALVLLSLLFSPNAYSLHRFYRDRLSKAFLFSADQGADGEPESRETVKLSELVSEGVPYHILNAAMNVQGSLDANRRGRDADFFLFSSQFVGSDLTFYAPTEAGHAATLEMEKIDPRLDLGTAMAISGAAISANMGSKTVRLLSPTLALLNIRLGYWLRNPRDLGARSAAGRGLIDATRRVREKFFLLTEMLNLQTEKGAEVLLTDGGHIENLGLYELLKRGCQLIIVIDGEADPEMSFASLLKAERYARIDLGVRIVLPWEKIAARSNRVSAAMERGRRLCRHGPHCAVGKIVYATGAEGIMLYFKSSLSGDEKDYILDYKRRNPRFPHETTGDQFFSEEQFEMYRALGFHMIDGFFSGRDEVAHAGGPDRAPNVPPDIYGEIDRLLPKRPPAPAPQKSN